MAIFHIDTSASVNGNGARETPFNTLPYANYNANYADNVFLLKAGTHLNATLEVGVVNNMIWGAYGKGPKPIWTNSGDRCLRLGSTATGQQVRDIKFRGINGALRILTTNTVTKAVARNLLIKGCSFGFDDAISFATSSDRIPVFVSGSGIKVYGSHFDDCPSDAIFIQAGNDIDIAYNKIQVGKGYFTGNADCVQIQAGDNYKIRYNQAVTLAGTKQVFLTEDAASTGGEIEYNDVSLLVNTAGAAINVFTPGTIVRRNRIRAKRVGIVCNRNATVESNLIFTDFAADVDYNLGAIVFSTSSITAPIARNNTCVGTGKGRGLVYKQPSGMTSGIFERNIFAGFEEAMYLGMASGYTQANNWFWSNAVNSNRALAATDKLLDADFDSDYIPQNPLAYRDNGTVYDPVVLDMYGRPFITSTVGAIQPDIIDFDSVMMPTYRASHDNV
jgi:hypothetical protein